MLCSVQMHSKQGLPFQKPLLSTGWLQKLVLSMFNQSISIEVLEKYTAEYLGQDKKQLDALPAVAVTEVGLGNHGLQWVLNYP